MTASVYLTLRGCMTAKHPSVDVLCCEDGSVMLPCSGTHKPRWTFGSNTSDLGYKRVRVKNRSYFVHRLVAESFFDNFNNYQTVDHIDRNPSNNNVHNLRWADYKMQSDNTVMVDASIDKYGCRDCDDRKRYKATYYRVNRDEVLMKQRGYYKEHKEIRLAYRMATRDRRNNYARDYYAKRVADGYIRKRINGKRVWVLNNS